MKIIIVIIIVFSSFFSISQTENNLDYYQNKLKELNTELQLLYEIKSDYEQTIDSISHLVRTDSAQIIATKLLVDFYYLKAENMRNQMIEYVKLIDALNALRKEY